MYTSSASCYDPDFVSWPAVIGLPSAGQDNMSLPQTDHHDPHYMTDMCPTDQYDN